MCTLKFFFIYCVVPVLMVFSFNSANGQTTNKIDSLLQLVEKQSEDTTKVKLLLKVSREYSKTDPGKAMDYSVQAYNLALKLKYTLGIIDAIIERSNDYTLTGQLDSALVLSQKAISMSDSIKNDKRRADSYSMHAGILIRRSGPVDARHYYFKANNLFKKIGDSTGYMNSLNGSGNCLLQAGRI